VHVLGERDLVADSFLALFVLIAVLGTVAWALVARREAPGRKAPRFRRRSRWLGRLPYLLALGAVAFLVLAFTQFRFLKEEGSAGTVILAMDVSESMGRTDVEPNRLEAAKEAARAFLDRLPTSLQVGLVTFAARSDEVVAPTTVRTDVSAALNDLPRSEGTVLGDGLDAALDAIAAQSTHGGPASGAVVLLSDGRDCGLAPSQCPASMTGSVVSATDAAARAQQMGVRVYTVLLGQAPATQGGGEAFALLQRIAETTEGSAQTADTAGGLIDIYQTLGTTISTELAISDYGAIFVGIAAVFAIAATGLILVTLRSEY
jgi:Ca-activated chloride channel family protein